MKIGYNYLMEQRKKTLSNEVNKFSNDLVNERVNILNSSDLDSKQHNNNDLLVDFLQKEVEELKERVKEEQEQKKYWQELYIKQHDEIIDRVFPKLLDTQEGNQQAEEQEQQNSKKGLFGWLFGK